MKKIGIFYASSTGYTAEVAHKIAKALGVEEKDIHNVAETAPSSVADYDVLLLGTGTQARGEFETAWFDFAAGLSVLDLRGKKIGLFGCGDETMSHTFCSGVGHLYDVVANTGAEIIGEFNTDGYEYDHCGAVIGGKVVGLVLDQINKPELTDKRITDWVALIK